MKILHGMFDRLRRKLGSTKPPRTEAEIEAEVLRQLEYKRVGARAAEAITAKDLNAVVGGQHCEFGSRVKF